MPDVQSGIEVEGAPAASSDDAFESSLARQVARQTEQALEAEDDTKGGPAAYKRARYEAEEATAEEIAASLLADGESTSVADGLTFADSTAEGKARVDAAERAQLEASLPASEARAVQLLEEEAAQKSELEGYRHQALLDRIWRGFEDDTLDPVQKIVAWSLVSTDEKIALMDEGIVTEDEAAQLEQTTRDANVVVADTNAEDQLNAKFEERLAESNHLINEWISEERLKPDEASARIAAAEEAAARQGIDIPATFFSDPAYAIGLLRAADATVQEMRRVSAQNSFTASLLSADSREVSSGLTQFGAFGHMPIQPREWTPAKPDMERITARASGRGRPTTADDIRRGVLSQGVSVKDGLTQGGKPVSVDQATGADKRHAQKLADDRARAMGL